MRTLFLLAFIALLLFLGTVLWKRTGATHIDVAADTRLQKARTLLTIAKASGQELSSGPCLGTIEHDWVADIAHNPRTIEDDQPENQCVDYRNGIAHHFLELQEDGTLLQAH